MGLTPYDLPMTECQEETLLQVRLLVHTRSPYPLGQLSRGY